MTLSKIRNLFTKSVNFVKAYPQAEVKSAKYLHPSAGFQLTHDKQVMVLKQVRNLFLIMIFILSSRFCSSRYGLTMVY